MQKFNLKDIEKKIWKLNLEDGITEITLALFLIISTICQIFDEFRFSLYLLYMIPVIFSIVAKKQITAPRIGFIKYNQERNKKQHNFCPFFCWNKKWEITEEEKSIQMRGDNQKQECQNWQTKHKQGYITVPWLHKEG